MALRALAEIAQENLSPPSNHLAGYMDVADKVGMTDTSKLQMSTSGSDVVRRMALGTTLRGLLLDALVFLANSIMAARHKATRHNAVSGLLRCGQGVSWRSRQVRECQRHFRQDPKNSPARPYLEGHTFL